MNVFRIAGPAGCLALPLLMAIVSAEPARAQSVDYGAYEQLFGEPVTTSATGKPQRLSEAPVDMDIITADQIARTGARTLPDVLSYVAGLNVRQYGMQDASVSIRGDDVAINRRVLVLLDGRQVYEDDYGLTVWPAIPVALDEIQQIEVIRGPNAALYGFNAVSGVINIITRNPLNHLGSEATVQGGTQNQSYGDVVSTVGRRENWAVRLAAQGYRSSEFDGDEADLERQQPRSGMVSLDGRFQVTPVVEWDVFGALSGLESAYFTDFGSYVPTSFRTNVLRTRLAYDSPVGLLRFDAYRNENRTDVRFPDVQANWRDDTVVVKASDLIKTGAHAFRIALDYRNSDAASENTFRGHYGYQDGAVSGMWEWALNPHIQLTNAFRVDALFLAHEGEATSFPGIGTPVHDAQITEPSFNSGLVVRPDDRDTLRFTIGRAAQLPSLIDFGLAITAGPIIVSGNSSLTPSVVTNYEVDWDRSIPDWHSTLRFAAFAQHTEATIGSPFGSGYTFLPPASLLLIARNAGNSDETGGEIVLKGQDRAGFHWNIGYALTAVVDRSSQDELATIPSVNYQRQTPTNAVTAGLGYRWQKLDTDLQARWQSHFQDYRIETNPLLAVPVTVANYVTMRLHVAYHLTRNLTVSVTADQLNRRQMPTTGGVPTDRQIVCGLSTAF